MYCTQKGGVLDWSYIEREMQKLGIADYEEANRNLALHLFGGEKLAASDQEMLDYILSSGTYGTVQNRIQNKIKKYGGGATGKAKYVFGRIFLPMDTVRTSFPLFIKIPILLPFLPLYRFVRGLTSRRDRMKAEWKALVKQKLQK